MPTVDVKRTYLEMTRPEDLRPAGGGDPGARIERAIEPPPSFYRYLYREVGRPWHWVDRLDWTDEDARRHVARPGVRLWVMYLAGSPAGYFELEAHDDGSVEIAYLGLLPEHVGRGLGKLLMTAATEEAWKAGANRVWLHTCSLDHPSALAAYVARGFRPFKEEIYTATLPASSGG